MNSQICLSLFAETEIEDWLDSSKSIPAFLTQILRETPIVQNGDRWEMQPAGQLARKDYEAFQVLVTALRGSWNRSARTHVFPFDPNSIIQKAIAAGKYPQKNPFALFPTPEAIVQIMFEVLGLKNILPSGNSFYLFADEDFKESQRELKFLEPSAGTGNIAREIRKYFPLSQIDCCEIDPFNRSLLRDEGFNLVGKDFMVANLQSEYDFILMNPPFSLKGNSSAYVDHIDKAFGLLLSSGKLAAIAPPGFKCSQVQKLRDFRNLVAANGHWEDLDPQSFAESGTSVNTTLIWIEPDKGGDLVATWTEQLILILDSDYVWHQFLNRVSEQTRSRQIDEIVTRMESRIEELIAQENYRIYCTPSIRNAVARNYYQQLKEIP